jgi:hypothetical protein
VDGAGEAAHGDEGAGAVVHAARARAVHVVASADRACPPLSLPLSVSCLRAPIRAGTHGLGRWEAGRARLPSRREIPRTDRARGPCLAGKKNIDPAVI